MDVVVLGGGYAGVSCALRLARRSRASRNPPRIRLVNPAPAFIERIRLHQLAAGQPLRERSLRALLSRNGIEFVQGWVERIDLSLHTVAVAGGSLRWDRLVLAPGSRTDTTRVPGASDYALLLEPERAQELRRRLESLTARARVVVLGGGLTAIELASEVAEAFPRLDVHLVSRTRVADGFSHAARSHIVDTLAMRLGVTLHEGVPVKAVAPNHLVTACGPIGFELCVLATGFAASRLARDAGLRVNRAGQVLVDPMLRSISHPCVSAAGDAASPVVSPGQPIMMGCKTAMPMGAHVGDNLWRELTERPGEPFDYALLFYCVSLGRRNGLIQWADENGRPRHRVLAGRRAAVFKEVICRSTWWAMQLEAKGYSGVVWKHTGHAPGHIGKWSTSCGERSE